MTKARKSSASGFVVWMFVLVGVFFAAYSAYWFYMRGQLEQGVLDWIGDERARGAQVGYETMSLKGFPYRFALHVDAPAYASPSGVAWSGERLELVMQPWNWQHVIARSPGRNDLIFAGRSMAGTLGRKSAGSLSWTGDGLNRLSIQLDEAEIADMNGDIWTATDFQLHVRPPADDPDALQLVLQWEALDLPHVLADAPYLGRSIQASRLLVEAYDAFPVINSGGSLRDWAKLGGRLDVAQLLLNWGPLKFGSKADLALRLDGRFDGTLNVRLEEGEALIEAMLGSGLAARDFAQTSMAITLVDGASKDGGFLPLSVRDSKIRYLGQSLGELPPAF